MVKQLDLFTDTHVLDSLEKKQNVWTLFVDGASRNNPGPSGAGIYIEKNGVLIIKQGYYLGLKTNNQAEYLALLLGLFILDEHVKKNEKVHIVSDSQLLVRQLTHIYKVKDQQLKKLHAVCTEKISFLNATIGHVLRDQNTQADAMANYGVDTKIFPPTEYIVLLKNYGIYLY